MHYVFLDWQVESSSLVGSPVHTPVGLLNSTQVRYLSLWLYLLPLRPLSFSLRIPQARDLQALGYSLILITFVFFIQMGCTAVLTVAMAALYGGAAIFWSDHVRREAEWAECYKRIEDCHRGSELSLEFLEVKLG